MRILILYLHSILLLASVVSPCKANLSDPDFDMDVKPILVKHCILCHGPGKQESGYRIDRFQTMVLTGDSGLPTIARGDAASSHLYQRITSSDANVRMPPKGEGLSPQELTIIRNWINAGVSGPRLNITNPSTDHWSFQQLETPTPPVPANTTLLKNEVDQFIQAKLELNGLSLSPQADRHTLIRRAFLVMLGLQPTPEEIDAFTNNKSPEAYAQLVESILASPHYGERWAQHWLDCVRYAESTGYEINKAISNIYPYRDYVIQAFNADVPYDQFIREQITGDLFAKDAATGFLMVGPHDTNPSPDPRLTAMQFQDGHDEIIKTVSAVTMGLTLGCARCHDHKFDPLTQHDYYKFQAVFAGVSYGSRAEQGSKFDQMNRDAELLLPRIEELRDRADHLRAKHNLSAPLDLREYDETFPPVKTGRIKFLINHTTDGNSAELDDVEIWTRASEQTASVNIAHRDRGATAVSSPTARGNQGKSADLLLDGSRQLLLYFKAADTKDVWFEITFAKDYTIDRITIKPRGRAVPADYQIQYEGKNNEWVTLIDSRNRYPHLTDTREADALNLKDVSADGRTEIAGNTRELRTLTTEYDQLRKGPQIYTGRLHKPRPTYLMVGGDPEKPGKAVQPGFITSIGSFDISNDAPESERRLALASSIATGANPLTARVITNRVWQHYFGTGIVETPSDFGVNGGSPSHPELLDWLSTHLIDNDWSLKQLHRVLLMSATFRQSSRTNAGAFKIDGESRLLWRFPPRRLEAEVLRDTMLKASGKLNLEQFGPPFKFFEERTSPFAKPIPIKHFDEAGWRRMIYGEKQRLTNVGVFGVFDCPDASQMTPKRSTSTSAVQALSLFNSEFVNRHAGFLASLSGTARKTISSQIEFAFLRTLSRPPTEQELQTLLPFVQQEGLTALGRILFNLNEFAFLN